VDTDLLPEPSTRVYNFMVSSFCSTTIMLFTGSMLSLASIDDSCYFGKLGGGGMEVGYPLFISDRNKANTN